MKGDVEFLNDSSENETCEAKREDDPGLCSLSVNVSKNVRIICRGDVQILYYYISSCSAVVVCNCAVIMFLILSVIDPNLL